VARRLVSACLTALAIVGTVAADSVVIHPVRDATLIEDAQGSLATGSGPAFFAGRIASTINALRRGLVLFDVAAAVPPGSTIEAVRLRLNVSLSPPGADPATVQLFRVTQSWGEGASSSFGGTGAPAQPGDATWIHRVHPDVLWSQPGGDFDPEAHGGTVVHLPGPYAWESNADMVADVQAWLDDPGSNFGWMIVGDESRLQTARRFDSRETSDPSLRPALEIVYGVPCRPDPAGFGFFKQACASGLDATVASCAARTFEALDLEGIDACGAVLAAPPPSCDARAQRKLAVLVLNLCTSRLQTSCPVDPDGACASANIGDLLAEVASLIARGDCKRAASCSLLPD